MTRRHRRKSYFRPCSVTSSAPHGLAQPWDGSPAIAALLVRCGDEKGRAADLSEAPYKLAFVIEQSLGHVTFGQNLQGTVADDAAVDPAWLPISFAPGPYWSRVPALGHNWSIRASVRAAAALRRAGGPGRFDAVFMHTQVTSLFAAHMLRRANGVVSLDATPRNYDEIGEAYQHARGPAALEALKDALNQRAFRAARHLVTWSAWAKQSLVRDYGLPPTKVTVIPPGTNLGLWERLPAPASPTPKVRLLFVGGDFVRKGGDLLLDVFRERLADHCELDIVTGAPVASLPPGVRVHAGLPPNSPPLRRLFGAADMFVLPTRADCLAVVLMEAMAAQLPVVSTRVGALDEAVQHGETGLLVPPDDGAALASAVLRLADDAALRERMGRAGYALAKEQFDARQNGRRLLALLKELARERRARRLAAHS